jgi:hypothetical protein
MVERVLNERRSWARNHIYLGDHYFHHVPLVLPLSAFRSHVQCFGGSRDGKSTLAAQLCSQFLAMADMSIVVIDHKGSPTLLNNLLQEAAQTVRPGTNESVYDIKMFTPQAGEYSHCFNPFAQSIWQRFTPLQRAEVWLDAFGIRAVEGSESAYFAAINEMVSSRYLDAHRLIETVDRLLLLMEDRDIYRGLAGGGDTNDWKHARHFVAMLARLADCPAVNRMPANAQEAIDVSEIVAGDRPSFVYFYLPTLEDGRVSQTCSRVFFKLLVRAASMLRFNRLRRPVLVLADESQHLFGPAFVETLEQAREFGISFLMFNQSRGQLITPSGDYRSTLDYCVGLQFMLSTRNPEDIDYVLSTAHETTSATLNWKQLRYPGTPLDESTLHPDLAVADWLTDEQELNVGERASTRPDRNQLLRASADQQGGLVRCFRNEGLWSFNANWVPFRWHRHVTPDEFNGFGTGSLPRLPGMNVNTPPSLNRANSKGGQSGTPSPITTISAPIAPSSLAKALEELAKKLNSET